ncbi:NAD-dependent epimerase/dehydratase family protein [Pseudaquabacterium rugosum]|uniref:NAD-dependent epimerase/dehydratase family protein n=1 Tax=Pseudaquabacterium rugosum TaxID=2984194 RepID=A0ABU9B6B1_9BURK
MSPPHTPRLIVLTGGTGFVGRTVCARLAARWPGVRLRVPTRRPAAARALAALPGVELVAADVHDPAQALRLLDGADALVHLVAILHGDATAFERTHVTLVRHWAQAAAQRPVLRRVVHVSALGVSPDGPSLYLRSKAAGERIWRETLTASGQPPALALLRPSVIFGTEDRFTNLFARLQRLAPVLPLAGADARFQPVAVGDVAEAVVRTLAAPPAADPVVECAGPEVLTLRQIVQRVGTLAGCARPVIGLPEAAGRLQASALGLLPGEPLMSVDNLLSMRVPNVASGRHPGLDSLGITAAGLDSLAGHFAPRGHGATPRS